MPQLTLPKGPLGIQQAIVGLILSTKNLVKPKANNGNLSQMVDQKQI